ncbi:MAG TPA: VOC family protein [Polyangiaceae bacterium]|nr:VOC family protein [Polyangiaceae bacterium]
MRLNQITLPSEDVTRGRDFYVRLGFTLIVDSPPDYVRLQAPEGGATLSLHRVPSVPRGHTAVVYLESDSLDADVARLVAAGFVFRQPPRDETWLWREARLLDPDGNELCLYHAGENRLNPPWRVKPA